MTDSFESAMAEMRDKVASPYWTDMADRLQKAHEREMEAVRDPQRIGGTLERGSFEYAIEQLREFRWQHATNDDDVIPYINGIAKAHEHDIEQLRRSRFREGYEAGQRSMDAEHYAVALRLRQLPLDEDSHGNLSQIARAVWHSDFGWTQGACAALRDELVRLMGGVHDEPVQVRQSGDSDCADCHRRDGESGRVDKRDSQKAPILANSDGEDGGKVTITDELRKFVAETWDGSMYVNQIPRNLQVIAYHIDERERKLRKQRDGFKRGMVAAQDLLEKRTDERDELQEKMDSMTQEYLAMRSALEISSSAMKEVVAERNEAREKLDAILRILDGGD